jgi:putative transcriptional regulator
VAETPLFVRQADAVWDDGERETFVDFIASNPEAGDIIPETGGVRKVRWASTGRGKRGGARVMTREFVARGKAGRAQARRSAQGRLINRTEFMGKFADDLITSLEEAASHARGRKVKGMRVTKMEVPDVKAIRRSLRMSQNRFAAAFRIPLPTLKNWEQGRRHPDAPAAAYLLAIKRRPREIMEAVAK